MNYPKDLREAFEKAAQTYLKIKSFFEVDDTPTIHKNQSHALDLDGSTPDEFNKDNLIDGDYYLDGVKLEKDKILPFKDGQTFITKSGKTGRMTDFVFSGKRTATEEDFEEVLQNEATKRNTNVNDINFLTVLKADLQKWKELHIQNTDSEKHTDYNILTLADKFIDFIDKLISPKKELKKDKFKPSTFKEIFVNERDIKPCLDMLVELEYLSQNYAYIGKNKGSFPIWIRTLLDKKLIYKCSDKEYAEVLNNEISYLKMTKDGSEFRKEYSRLRKNNFETDLMLKFSQISHYGRLGK